jgi:hypothetical protein
LLGVKHQSLTHSKLECFALEQFQQYCGERSNQSVFSAGIHSKTKTMILPDIAVLLWLIDRNY